MNAFRTRNAFFLILGKREKTNIQKVALNYYVCEHFYSWSGLFSVQFCKDISGILLFHVRLKNSVHSGRIVWLELSLFNLSCWIFFCYRCRYVILYRQWIQCITFITICVPCGRCMLLVEYSVWQWSELLPNIILSQAQWSKQSGIVWYRGCSQKKLQLRQYPQLNFFLGIQRCFTLPLQKRN